MRKLTFLLGRCMLIANCAQTSLAQQWLGSPDENGNLWRNSNLGINNNNPQYNLDVLGTTKTDKLYFSDSNREIEWLTSTWAAGYGHKIWNRDLADGKGVVELIFSTRSGTTNWTDAMMLTTQGKLLIGVTDHTPAGNHKLYVKDGIRTEKVRVDVATQNGWADFVFEPDYHLKPLSEVETFIKDHKHLPDVPSEKELEEKGMDLGEMHKIQMQKIEELTLYMIALKKENQDLKKRIEALEK